MSKPMPPPAKKPSSPALIAANTIVAVAISLLTFALLVRGADGQITLRAKCCNNLKNIWMALHAYTQDNEDRLPFTRAASDSANKHFGLLFPKWLRDERVFICMGATNRGYRADNKTDEEHQGRPRRETLRPGENCYAFAFGLGGPVTFDSPLICDQFADCHIASQRWASKGIGSNHGKNGANVIYMDGHVVFLRANAEGYWPAKEPKMKAMFNSRVCDPANAAPSPEDK